MGQKLLETTAGAATPITRTRSLETVTIFDDANIIDCEAYELEHVIVINTPTAGIFTAAVTNICTKAAHGFPEALKVRLTTTTLLPAGLSLATDYFVHVIDVNTFYLASSLANLDALSYVDITDTGTGDHTITAEALAGLSLQKQTSDDGSTWSNSGSATAITVTGNQRVAVDNPCHKKVKTLVTITAGYATITQNVTAKNDKKYSN